VILAVDGGWRAPLEGLLLVVGLLLYLAGSIAAGLSVAPTHAPGPLVVWGFVGFAAGSLLFFVAQTVLSLIAPSNAGWVWGEAQLWAAAGLGVLIWLSVQDGLDAT
jgi:MFS family permease